MEGLAVAASLARSDLGVDFVYQKSLSGSGVLVFEYTLPAWGGHPAVDGRLVVCRPVVDDDVPIDITVEQALDPRFPSHPTALQLFDNREFEAYRALGRLMAQRGAMALRFPGIHLPESTKGK
jgi:hypothetical protein